MSSIGCSPVLPNQAAAEILGRVRGERVAMLVHHSRNSVQKQWDETLVLALGGMARILRAHLPLLVPMPGFAQVACCSSGPWPCSPAEHAAAH
jgi:hypothetical protein